MIFQKNLPFTNVAANSVASLELPIGMTYERLYLVLGGTTFTKALITNIRLKLNGKIFWEMSATELELIQAYKSATLGVTYAMIDFTEMEAKTLGGQYVGSIGTGAGVTSFVVEVTIGAATAPTLESYSVVSPPTPLGFINAMLKHTVTFAAAGTFPVVPPHGAEAGFLIKRVYFMPATATNLTDIEIKKNGLVIYEKNDFDISEMLQLSYGRTATAAESMYVYDTILNKDMKQILDTSNAQSLQYNLTVAAADAVTIYTDCLALLGNV